MFLPPSECVQATSTTLLLFSCNAGLSCRGSQKGKSCCIQLLQVLLPLILQRGTAISVMCTSRMSVSVEIASFKRFIESCAGVDPYQCVPMLVDVGTNNPALLADPQYKGLKQKRVTGDDYDTFIQEVVESVKQWQPHSVLQFEDFGNHNAFRCALSAASMSHGRRMP